jgi:protein ImuB
MGDVTWVAGGVMAGQRVAYLWVPYFAAAVARRADHTLGGRPLVLMDEQGRVLAADAEAAGAGVVPGMPERSALARCSHALCVPATRYPIWETQEALWEQIRSYAGRWQPDGLGRLYLDAAWAGSDLLGWCQAVAGVTRRLGWEPALGATASKFGAGVAGQVAGENTALLVTPAAQRTFLADQPMAALPLGADALLQLRYLGIRTLGQFACLPPAGVVTRFGPAGRTAQRWAQGLDDRPVIPPWEAPEVSTRIEFDAPLADRDRLLAVLVHHAGRMLAPLHERLQAAGRAVLAVTRIDGRVIPAGYTFPMPTAALERVRLGLAAALDRVAWDGQAAAEITLTLAGITDAPGPQLTLFDFDVDGRARLRATLDRLVARFGPDAFRLATLTDPHNPLPERRASWRKYDE